MKLVLVMVFVSACVKSNAVECDGDRLCPEGTACDETHKLCVEPDQLTACDGKNPGDACTYASGSGNCHDGVCLPGICGNGIVDGVEVCDDGNQKDGDGCSADCLSAETCGNGIVDIAAGEECDDSNHVDRDGCDSLCARETSDWALVGDAGARSEARAAFDAARGKIVMFGGDSAYHVTTDTTSEWDGQWRGQIRTVPPPNRYGFGMAYFAPSHHVVIQGGSTGGQVPRRDTWEWDGVTWHQLADGPIRAGQAMAYDAKRKRIVMYGGRSDTGPTLAETWEFDGTTWMQKTPTTSPAPNENATMTYDPDRGVIVMHGGSGTLGELWEYDGTTWTNKSVLGIVPQLSAPKIAYCAKLHHVIEFGGFSGTSGTNHTYAWTGSTWTDLGVAPVSTRGGVTLVEDGRGNVLLYGGRATDTMGAASLADTWSFDGATWTAVTPTPFPRQDMAFASSLTKTVVFGGKASSAGAILSDTWELTRTGWKQFPDGPLPTDAPPPTDAGQMVYDEQHDTFVLFGGSKNGTLDDITWIRAGTAWSSIHPTPSPAGRGEFGFAYDGARHEAVLFGGIVNGGTPSGETWTFNGTTWTLKTPAHTPGPRGVVVMAYDPEIRMVVLYGGADGVSTFRDTWFWDGTDWSNVTPAGDSMAVRIVPGNLLWNDGALLYVGGIASLQFDTFETWQLVAAADPMKRAWKQLGTFTRPPGRAFAMAANAPDRSGLLVAGGVSISGPTIADQWVFSVAGPHPHDSCAFDIDLDGDGQVRCTDGDCWQTCNPQCPPNASCTGTEPHCGDGTCNAWETCHTCPQDCTSCPNICGDFICDPGEMCPGDC